MVARVTYNDGSDSFLCSGTVVASNVILTAGHCAENETTGAVETPGNYQVLTGSQSLSSPGQLSGVTQVIPYPTFNPSTLQGDAALLVLATPTTASPVTLASDPTDVSLYDGGTATVITGWGIADSYSDLPSELQYGFSVVQSPGYCAQQASQHGATFNTLTQLCAVDAPTDADGTCNGDSGGPILGVLNQTWVEIGLTSFGASNCSTAIPGFFTRTDTIDSWIQAKIQQNAPAPPNPSPPAAPPSTPTTPTAPTNTTAPTTTPAPQPTTSPTTLPLAPTLTLAVPHEQLAVVRKTKKLTTTCTLASAGTCTVTATITSATAKKLGLTVAKGTRTVTLATAANTLKSKGKLTLTLKFPAKDAAAFARVNSLRITLTATSTAANHTARTTTQTITLI
jgi:secreted trypsin-like serine protease